MGDAIAHFLVGLITLSIAVIIWNDLRMTSHRRSFDLYMAESNGRSAAYEEMTKRLETLAVGRCPKCARDARRETP